jgi:transposase
MTKKDINKWIMYTEIHKLKRFGFSGARIARYLVMNPRTVSKYLLMTVDEYEQFLLKSCERNKKLSTYESFVFNKLSLYQDTSTAQIHDWLKENYIYFPDVSTRTVYNFVMYVRQKYNIPIVSAGREFFPVEELPYGEQAQIDFGEYNMRLLDGTRKKVRFFAMVLSRSRMKFIWFTDKPFTAQLVVHAHEKAFEYLNGIPKTIVYDQDKTMLVDENIGNYILTSAFNQYTLTRNFNLHFCRKSDPQSKGKIENVIQYVKKNFLYNRVYYDIETLNNQALAWLARTANAVAHNYTKKIPQDEYFIEKEYLNPYVHLSIETKENKMYHVKKTNIIAYKSNFYSVPSGSYKSDGTQVIVKEKDNIIEIYTLKDELLCTHKLSYLKGQTITNTNHRRDTSKSIDEMINQAVTYFTNQALALDYLNQIRKQHTRYTRDHLQIIMKALTILGKEAADKALLFCLKNDLLDGYEFEQVINVLYDEIVRPSSPEIKLMNKTNLLKANEKPQTSNINDYEDIINF